MTGTNNMTGKGFVMTRKSFPDDMGVVRDDKGLLAITRKGFGMTKMA